MAARRENIVIFPFMAQGHIIPFFALALYLENKKGYKNITFVNTPLNIKKLTPSLPPDSSIKLHELPFNSSDHGLPTDTENSDSLPYLSLIRLVQSSISLKPAFASFISDLVNKQEDDDRVSLCIIADFFLGWTVDVAHEFGAFHTIFSGASGFGLACYYSVFRNLPHKKSDYSGEFSLPDFPEAGKLHVTQLAANMLNADGTDPWSVFQHNNLSKWLTTDGMLFNTVEDLDRIGLGYFRRKIGKPIWPIGPILLSVENRARVGKKFGIESDLCLEWLDSKPVNSVLYISFGSQNTISASQMMQLAMALEKSGKDFIWVVRPPLNFDINAEFKDEEWLPEGFIRRMEDDENRGLIVNNWAPQMEILSHKSVSAFMSHCGWNSTLEALSNAVPLIGWPMAAEQFFNVKYLEEKVGVCVELARGTNFEVRHEDIVGKIELVMNETEKGKDMKRKACEIRDVIMDAIEDEDDGFKGSSATAMDEFLNAALSVK